jgi:ribosomal protein S18 acetylase RimI-like enzyme
MNLTMRTTVTSADCENIRRIVESSHFFNDEEIDIAVELAEEHLRIGAASGYLFLFVEDSGRTVAYSCYGRIGGTESSYDLYWIAVDDAYRGKGIGRIALDETMKLIEAEGGKRVYAETSSREQYEPTRSFYLKNSFYQEAFIKDFYADGDSKVIYTREI